MTNAKGQDFEREESRFISLWWTNNDRDDIFWRNRVKITSKTPNAERQLGDLTCNHTIGLPFIETFSVELKAGYSKSKLTSMKKKNEELNKKRIKEGKEPKALSVRNVPWDLLDIVDGRQIDDELVIFKFWEQCLSDAELSGRIPLLIFKRDFHCPTVCVNLKDFKEIIGHIGDPPERNIVLSIKKDKKLSFFRHSDFFEWLTPEAIKAVHRSKNV